METRVCRECGKELPITEFQKTRRGDSRFHVCRQCVKSKQRNTRNAKVNAPYIDMSKFDDDMLFAELRNRGYKGQLELSKTIAV